MAAQTFYEETWRPSMRLTTLRLTAPLALTGSLLAAGRLAAQEPDAAGRPVAPSFWHAAAGVVGVNGLTWAYNWYVQRWHWANVGTRAWWKNLRDGFIWDDDAFGANQLAHPYHGSLYFNAARASGYGFWGSTPFVAAGSIGWELLSENVHPSLNDLINTTLGGIALGEVTFRLSSLLAWGDRSKRGALGRKAGAFALSPVGRAQGFLNGVERSAGIARHPRPESSGTWIAVGQRREMDPAPQGTTSGRPFVGLSFQYGSPFDERMSRPYDAFEFSLQGGPEAGVITHAAVSGLLARRHLARSTRGQLVLGLFQHFDYDELPAFKASSQSLSGGLLFRRQAGEHSHFVAGLHLEALPLGAVSSDHNGFRRRDYDYGPGMGSRFMAALRHDGRDLLRLDGRVMWIHSLYGADADHVATTARVSALVPVMRNVGVGGDAGLMFRRSTYRDHPRVLTRIPQLRAYLVWSPS